MEEVAAQVFQGIDALEPRRRYLCVEWLIAHCQLTHGENLHGGLAAWLSGLPQEEVIHQVKLVRMEIDWWTAQTDGTVERLMWEHFAGRRS
jgi:hypothetical protein